MGNGQCKENVYAEDIAKEEFKTKSNNETAFPNTTEYSANSPNVNDFVVVSFKETSELCDKPDIDVSERKLAENIGINNKLSQHRLIKGVKALKQNSPAKPKILARKSNEIDDKLSRFIEIERLDYCKGCFEEHSVTYDDLLKLSRADNIEEEVRQFAKDMDITKKMYQDRLIEGVKALKKTKPSMAELANIDDESESIKEHRFDLYKEKLKRTLTTSSSLCEIGKSKYRWDDRTDKNQTCLNKTRLLIVGMLDERLHASVVISYFTKLDGKILTRVYRIDLLFSKKSKENILRIQGPVFDPEKEIGKFKAKYLCQVKASMNYVIETAEQTMRNHGGYHYVVNNCKHFAKTLVIAVAGQNETYYKPYEDKEWEEMNTIIHEYCQVESTVLGHNNQIEELTFEEVKTRHKKCKGGKGKKQRGNANVKEEMKREVNAKKSGIMRRDKTN